MALTAATAARFYFFFFFDEFHSQKAGTVSPNQPAPLTASPLPPATGAAIKACPSQPNEPSGNARMEEGERRGQREGGRSTAEIQQLWPFPVGWE